MIFVGVDWAEAHHDVHIQDENGKRLGGGRLPEGVDGIARFHELAARYAQDPGEVVTGIETDRGLFVAAGYQVFAVNPMSTSRYRDRHSASGAKSDPGDAKVLADTTLDPRHRMLLRVEIESLLETDKRFVELLGKDPGYRAKFILESSGRAVAEELDV